MAEISRIDAIKIAEFNLEIFDSNSDISKFMRKAISDMQKLEKIEQIINEYSFAEQYAYQTLDSIEQILFPSEDSLCGDQICANCDYEGGIDCINDRQIDLCKEILKGES